MNSADETSLISFLQSCSTTSLADFVLARLARDRQLSKDLHTLLDRLVENRALGLLGSLLRDHGQQLLRGGPR